MGETTITLENDQWQIILRLLENQKNECEYFNRKGYLILEEIHESISTQTQAIPCESA